MYHLDNYNYSDIGNLLLAAFMNTDLFFLYLPCSDCRLASLPIF